MTKLFGTDGIRGVANSELTAELAYKLGRAAGYLLSLQGDNRGIAIGKDTRISGDMLESALMAGVCSVGVDVYRLGIIPTPGVAYLTKVLKKSAGVVISASHNPFADNGIKFFSGQGMKLPDEIEAELERLIDQEKELPFPTGAKIGRIYQVEKAGELYREHVQEHFRGSLKGLKIVLDCSHGAAFEIAPKILEELGAEVITLFSNPNGININCNCGSTHLDTLQKRVLAEKAHLGLAHDGDADRLLAIDEKGRLVDGDQILVISALALKEQDKLVENKLVVTVMSNLGLHKAMEKAGIEVIETKVGDRYVLEKMVETGAILGGEQSGHIIFLQQNSTGDGLVTALNILQAMVDSGKPLSSLAGQMEKYPQVMINVVVTDKAKALNDPKVTEGISVAKKKLNNRGRVLVRPSGTEPMIRVMVEGPDKGELQEIAENLASLIETSR